MDSFGGDCYSEPVLSLASAVTRAMRPFGLALDPEQVDQVSTYIGLLTSWGRVINLTTIREPDEILRRHFGESLYLASALQLTGNLLDVGSGAGFPGLALKIVRHDLGVTLLEPGTKKRAFLKEVVRTCRFRGVEIRGEHVEEFCETATGRFDFVTMRAVGSFRTVLPSIKRCLASTGRACLWLTGAEVRALAQSSPEFRRLFEWDPPLRVPLSQDREIWVGRPRPEARDVPRET